MIRYALIVVLVLLVGYGAMEARPIVLGPTLTLINPQSGGLATSTITVSGRVSRAVALSVNGAPVLPNEDGTWSDVLTLPTGSGILTVTATDRFGRSITKTRTVFVP